MSALDDCYNVFDLRDAAKGKLPKAVFEFVDRSTEDERSPSPVHNSDGSTVSSLATTDTTA